MTDLLTAARAELIADEGLRLKPYTDTVGKITIGIGRNLTDVGISKEEAYALCDTDIVACLADLQTFAWFAGLNGSRTLAVINLRFNLGPGRFRTFTKFLAGMAVRDYQAAAHELVQSKWYGQVQQSRRDRIVRQIREGA